jgi:hypothetical protein
LIQCVCGGRPSSPYGLVVRGKLACALAQLRGRRPVLAPMAMYIASSSRLQTPEFVEGAAQVVLDYRFGGANGVSDFAVGQPFPDRNRNLYFFRATRS